jgi:hypothetical protein
MLSSYRTRVASPNDVRMQFLKYQKMMSELRDEINSQKEIEYIEWLTEKYLEYYKRRYPDGIPNTLWKKEHKKALIDRSRHFQDPWFAMIYLGRDFMEMSLRTVSIPRGKAKEVEKAARLFISARRIPLNIYQWFHKNEKLLSLPAQMIKWPTKGETEVGFEEQFKIGPLQVHNTIQLEGKKLEETKKVLRKIVRLIKTSKVKGAAKTLYGDVLIVARLNQPKVMAWYNIPKDQVWIRYLKGKDLHNGIHEFGHRLWRKFLPKEMKDLWRQYHFGVNYSHQKVEIPKVGDPLNIPIRGEKDPKIVKIEGDRFFISEKSYVKYTQIRQYLENAMKYPTAYSATNEEEHFCEAFALYCQKRLKPEHAEKFEEIFV